MDRSISDELYSETLRHSNGELGPSSQAYQNRTESHDNELGDLSHDDNGSFWDCSEEQSSGSDLNREWQRRRDQFYSIGYRDGVTAGKEASAQEGFNVGFKESVHVGYRWGLVRGVTSALACLPGGLREKMVESHEEIAKFQSLYKSVHSLSTTDALKSFYDSSVANRQVEQYKKAEASDAVADQETENSNILLHYSEELKSLILKSPAIEVNFVVDQ